MAWEVWGNPYLTGELSNTTRHQPVIFHDDIVLRACRTWVVIYNNPVFTNLQMKIYSSELVGGSQVPKKLLHTSSNSPTKAEIITLSNGVKEIYFDFDFPVFSANDTYHFVLSGTGYTGTTDSHIAWQKAFPDPVNRTGLTLSANDIGIAPFQLYFIGSEL